MGRPVKSAHFTYLQLLCLIKRACQSPLSLDENFFAVNDVDARLGYCI